MTGHPARPDGGELEHPVVVALTEGDAYLEEVGGQHGRDPVAPLDEHDTALVEELLEAEVADLLEPVEAINVEVVQREPALVAVHQREGRAGDGLVHPQRGPEPLGEGGLAGTEIAGEQHDVARARQLCHRSGKPPGGLGTGGAGGNGSVGHDPPRYRRRQDTLEGKCDQCPMRRSETRVTMALAEPSGAIRSTTHPADDPSRQRQETTVELPIPEPDAWYAADGPFVTCWLPALEANEDPAHRLRLEWRHAREQVPTAPAAALESIEALLGSERAHRDATSLLLVAGADGAIAGVHLPDHPPAARAWCDALPRLGPALRARQQVVPHVVVVADRAGADIEVVNHGPAITASVEGETTFLHRGHPGGWSQRRYQQRAENTWEQNATGVAAEVDALAAAVGARLVVVTGDPRAVGFLTEHATERLRGILHHVEGAGRSDHEPFAEVADQVHRLEATLVAADLASVLERFTAARQTDGVADGPERTLALLSQGRVAELLVHDDPEDERTAAFDRASRQAAMDPSVLTELGLTPTSGRLVDVALWAAHTTGAAIHLVPQHGPNVPSGSVGGLLRG